MARLILHTLKLVIGVIILFNVIHVEHTFKNVSNDIFPIRGGVTPFNISEFETMDDIEAGVARLAAFTTLATTYSGHRSDQELAILPMLMGTSYDNCRQKSACHSMYLFQHLEDSFLASVNSSEHSFITLYQAPFYHVRVQFLLGGTRRHELCRTYGWGTRYWDVCTSNFEVNGEKLLAVGSTGNHHVF